MVFAEFSVPVPMRDSINLSTIIIKPEKSGQYPLFLLRTPYSAKKMFTVGKMVSKQFNSVIVLQDCRGRYDSEGVFRVCDEKEDTLDTISWIKQQDWFNGELHIFGPSYLGYVALQILDEDINIKTIFAPTVLGSLKDSIYRGNVLQYHWALPWTIMTSTRVQSSLTLVNGKWPEVYKEVYKKDISLAVQDLGWPDHIWKYFLTPLDNTSWDKHDLTFNQPLDTRICLIGAWFDFLLNATLKTYEDLLQAGGKKPDLILGPWSHNGYLASQAGVESWEFGTEGKSNFLLDMKELLERERNNDPQIIKAFILRANKWVNLDSWPPNSIIEKKFYLDVNQELSEEPSKEDFTELLIEIDLENPVPTLGGNVWESYHPIEPGPVDQSPLLERIDILQFYTGPLEKSFTILGPMSVELWIKTDVPETHFTAKLVVVDAENEHKIFQDGILQITGPTESFVKITIDLLATGIKIDRNERIGLEISWSNFPKFTLPYLNGKTTQKVLISRNKESFLKIPIING